MAVLMPRADEVECRFLMQAHSEIARGANPISEVAEILGTSPAADTAHAMRALHGLEAVLQAHLEREDHLLVPLLEAAEPVLVFADRG